MKKWFNSVQFWICTAVGIFPFLFDWKPPPSSAASKKRQFLLSSNHSSVNQSKSKPYQEKEKPSESLLYLCFHIYSTCSNQTVHSCSSAFVRCTWSQPPTQTLQRACPLQSNHLFFAEGNRTEKNKCITTFPLTSHLGSARFLSMLLPPQAASAWW